MTSTIVSYITSFSRRGVIYLAEVTPGSDESFDSLLKRFNRKVQQDGILAELRRREHYEKPSVKRKRKKAAKKRGSAKSTRNFRRSAATR